MGREARRRAAQRGAASQTPHHTPVPPGLERRKVLHEQFATETAQVLELVPEDAEDGVDVAQVALVLIGRPAFLTRAGKVYTTAFSPEVAIQVGEALAQSGRTLAQRPAPEVTDSGLVTAGSMREAEAIARQNEQVDQLRG